MDVSLFLFAIIFYLTNIFLLVTIHYISVCSSKPLCLLSGSYTNISSLSTLSLQTRNPRHKVAYSFPKTIYSSVLFNVATLGRVWRRGVRVGVVRWCGGFFFFFKALCLLRGTVISGGRGEVWRCRPWILVTGYWWSPPASPGTRHSGIYSQRCRSRSWAVRRPSANTEEKEWDGTYFNF